VGTRAGMEAMAKRKTSLPLPGIDSRSSRPWPEHYTELLRFMAKDDYHLLMRNNMKDALAKFKVLSDNLNCGTEEDHEDNRASDRNSNPGSPEHRASWLIKCTVLCVMHTPNSG